MTVRKRGSRWWYDFRLRNIRYREPIPEAQTKAEALVAEAKVRSDLFGGRYGGIRLTPLLTDWISDTYLPWAHSNKRSWYDDEWIARIICDHFKKMRLRDISSLHVEKFKKVRRETPTQYGNPRQPATVNRELAILSKVFQLAVDAGYIESNPCRKVKRIAHDNSRTRFLSDKEELSLLDALDQESSLYSIVQLALNTGMRRGEILSLKWSEVDLNRGLICVTQTKTNRNRIIPMNQVVRELLSQQQGQGEYVFTSPRTKGCLVEIKKGFKKACQLAGIHDFHFHDLRHTAASRLAATGADIVTIAEILGHSSFRMTKRYTHASEERKRNALESMVSKNVVTIWSQNEKGRVAALP
jgi:integrase